MTLLNSDQKASLQEKLKALQKTYADALPGKMDEIDASWNSFTTSRDENTLEDAIRLTHKLAGTAKTYGFGDLGEYAKAAELNLISLKETPDDTQAFSEADQTIQKLRTEIPR
ncbi:Hpt domain-containing protein [Thalassospira sp. MA62]|nr:Hpt domain-containing protein [Thalassospira sp. MA62]